MGKNNYEFRKELAKLRNMYLGERAPVNDGEHHKEEPFETVTEKFMNGKCKNCEYDVKLCQKRGRCLRG